MLYNKKGLLHKVRSLCSSPFFVQYKILET